MKLQKQLPFQKVMERELKNLPLLLLQKLKQELMLPVGMRQNRLELLKQR